VRLKKGDTYTSYPSGGGGWGSALERDPEAVRLDARNGIISLSSAREIYGVVLEGVRLEVDREKTEVLRAGLAKTPPEAKTPRRLRSRASRTATRAAGKGD
jgi:N-methylhydantoinase B